ncbi:hypothetical protein TcCL_Unassigned02495 [Trypanosoma cruzi]|nr:hypothetical protein TcCL_Unassigned02495 [Trypanosoma cruzi]
MEVPNAQGGAGSHPRSLSRTHPLPQLSHTQKGKDMEKRNTPHNARRSTAIHVAPQERVMRTADPRPQRKGRSAYMSAALSLLLSAPTDRHYASQQVVASGAIHSQ